MTLSLQIICVIYSSLQKVITGLNDDHNVPTLLQSLGSILENSPSVYALYEREVTTLFQDILSPAEVGILV